MKSYFSFLCCSFDFHECLSICRCLDEIFLTWNDSIDAFRALLNSSIHEQQHLSPFLLTISIDKQVNYLDAEISHINGRLRTGVHHNLRIEPYALPYISNQLLSSSSSSFIDNDRLTVSSISEALIRAARCCSNVVDFEREQYFIHWPLDLNYIRHRPLCIYWHISSKIARFFTKFTDGELYFNSNDYDKLRHRVRQYDYKRTHMEIERRQNEQKQETWYITYPFQNKLLFTHLKRDFERFWLRCCNYDQTADLTKFNLQFLRRSQYPHFNNNEK